MNHKLVDGMKIWKGNWNTATLLFPLKGTEILHQERRGQVKTIVIEHLNDILFHKSGLANKQHINQSINQCSCCVLRCLQQTLCILLTTNQR